MREDLVSRNQLCVFLHTRDFYEQDYLGVGTETVRSHRSHISLTSSRASGTEALLLLSGLLLSAVWRRTWTPMPRKLSADVCEAPVWAAAERLDGCSRVSRELMKEEPEPAPHQPSLCDG